MTVQNADREAIRHGKITEKPLRERPSYPTWAVKLTMAITGLIFGLYVLGHMVGNLKIFMPLNIDGSAPIDDYGEFLRTLDRNDPHHLALMYAAGSLFRGAGYVAFDGEVPEHAACHLYQQDWGIPLVITGDGLRTVTVDLRGV